jgi:hypothetical protein
MAKRTKLTLAIVVLAGLAPLGVLADKLAPRAERQKGPCLCACQGGPAKHQCAQRCALAHDEEGPCWTGLCLKRPASRAPKNPTSHPQPSDDDDLEVARR